MAYVATNPKTKKALREAVAEGDRPLVFQPGGLFPLNVPANRRVTVEGPHYPEPHKWYAVVELDSENRVERVVS